jgi:hypothetical protein
MYTQMNHDFKLSTELFFTQITGIWAFSAMYSQIYFEITLPIKEFFYIHHICTDVLQYVDACVFCAHFSDYKISYMHGICMTADVHANDCCKNSVD